MDHILPLSLYITGISYTTVLVYMNEKHARVTFRQFYDGDLQKMTILPLNILMNQNMKTSPFVFVFFLRHQQQSYLEPYLIGLSHS